MLYLELYIVSLEPGSKEEIGKRSRRESEEERSEGRGRGIHELAPPDTDY